MAQENENRLHAYMTLVGVAGQGTLISASGGIDLDSITPIGGGEYEFDLVDGVNDGEYFVAIGTGVDPNNPAGFGIIPVQRVTDPDQKRFKINLNGGDTPGEISGSVSWWRVPVQGATGLLPPSP